MKHPIFQVDAFCDSVFTGNPAAVVMLDAWLSDDRLLAIAEENNLSETAFVIGGKQDWELRWFTPKTEVALCGHATLAAGHALFENMCQGEHLLRFATRESGTLTVEKHEGVLSMNFPSLTPSEITPPKEIEIALGVRPLSVWSANYSANERDLLAVFETEQDVANLSPDFSVLQEVDTRGLICTAPGRTTDFVSRYFAPAAGVPEDPFTGSAHCILTPYWAAQFGKTDFSACQISARQGWAICRLQEDRVVLSGKAVTYMKGEIAI